LRAADYPHGAQIASRPATNQEADRFLHPVHRSTFEQLHRQDGLGWLQFARWEFRTGKGGATQNHVTTFGYGISVFPNHKAAQRSLQDVKLKVRPYRVAHLAARIYSSVDTHQALTFVFFDFRAVEVEAYYEYTGVAPRTVATSLRHTFSRQLSHLAHTARLLDQSLRSPAPTATPTMTLIPTATPTLTPTPVPTATSTPRPTSTPIPTAVPTSSPAPTATPAPAGLQVTAHMREPNYHVGSQAIVDVVVTNNGQQVVGARIVANFLFPFHSESCSATTDASGSASCSVPVPEEAEGTPVNVDVQAVAPDGDSVLTQTSFTVSSFGSR
jgi:hypothetical protein